MSPDLRRVQVNQLLSTQVFHLDVYSFTVPGHKSALAFGFLRGVPVVAMLGRVGQAQSVLLCILNPLVPSLRRSHTFLGGLSGPRHGKIGSEKFDQFV